MFWSTKMKKILIPFLSLIILLALFGLLSAGTTEYELIINDEITAFTNPPLVKASHILLPIDETLEYFGAHPIWMDEGKFMSCLYNNNFSKLTLGRPAISINGIEEQVEQAPISIDGVAYAPLSFFCDFLVLNSSQTDTTIELKNRNTQLSTLFGITAFEERKIPQTDIKLALPEPWQQLSETSIGVSNPYETYSFELNIVPNYTRLNANAYIAEIIGKIHKEAETKKYKMDNMESSYYSTDDHTFDVFYYSTTKTEEKAENKVINRLPIDHKENKPTTDDEESQTKPDTPGDSKNKAKEKPIYHAHFILIENATLYDFHFRHNKFNAKNRVLKDFENALKTLRLDASSLNTYYEHYFETEAFHNYGLSLKSSIYSNMEVKDNILIEGSLTNPNIRELRVKVTKEGELYEYPIEVQPSGEFSSFVYSPFGVGKHNFTLYTDTEGGKKDLLKFSALNISGTDIAYTIPSEKVVSNSAETRELLTLILDEAGKNRSYSSDYSVASSVFDHVKGLVLSCGLDENLDRDLAFDEITFRERMSEKEVAIVYCSLIRAAGIPCRIMKGENREISRVFTSCYINGNWYIYDIVSEYYRSGDTVSSGDKVDYIPELRYPSTKHLSFEKYNGIFDKMIELEY